MIPRGNKLGLHSQEMFLAMHYIVKAEEFKKEWKRFGPFKLINKSESHGELREH